MTNDWKDPKLDKTDAPASEGGESKPERKRSGRVTFDARGNSVWEWQLETGVYSRDVNTQKLKKLDLGDLSIAETAIEKGPPAAPGGGFNPYHGEPRSRQEGSNPYDTARSLGNKIAPKNERPLQRPRSLDDLRKLSEWIKQKRQMERGEK